MELFERSEQKYRLTEEQYARLMESIGEKLEADPYSPYMIHSLYFDNYHQDLVRHNADKPAYRLKVRLRWYSRFEEPFFLEIKRKYKGTTYKKRIELTQDEAGLLLENRLPYDMIQDPEISRILAGLSLVPDRLVSYSREAFTLKSDPGVRITFDRRLEAVDFKGEENGIEPAVRLLDEGEVLMECKALYALPLEIVSAMSCAGILETSFSKSMNSWKALKGVMA